MIKRLVLLLVFLAHGMVSAAPLINLYKVTFAGPPVTVFQTSYAAACSNWMDAMTAFYANQGATGSWAVTIAGAGGCQITTSSGILLPSRLYAYGPGASTSSGIAGKMGCAGDVTPTNGVCPDPPPTCAAVSAGSMDVTTSWATGSQPGSALAKKVIPDGGLSSTAFCPPTKCTVKASGPPTSCSVESTASASGYYRVHCTVPMDQIGGSCDSATTPGVDGGAAGAAPTAPPPPLGKCPAGSSPGGVDSSGMTVCVGSAPKAPVPTSVTASPATTATDAAGNTVTSQVITNSNADGSSTATTTTTTTAPDGTKTVAVNQVTTAATGGAAGTPTLPQDQYDMCKLHPDLTVCRNSQVLGTCGTITCDGDAIQCATLRAAAAMECKQRADEDVIKASSQYALGTAAASGTDPASSTFPTPGNGVTVNVPASLDQSGFLGAGAPFPDKTFTIQGKTITMPFSTAVGYLVVLRYALMVVAMLVSFKILSGAILRE